MGVLLVVLAVVLVLRVIGLALVNRDRLDADRLEGLAFSGRYYPIEMPCRVVDTTELEAALAGDSGTRDPDLSPKGNTFKVYEPIGLVMTGCAWTSSDSYEGDPRVSVGIEANVLTERRPDAPACSPEREQQRDQERDQDKVQDQVRFKPVAVGQYQGCQIDDLAGGMTYSVHDDNVSVWCSVKAVNPLVLPALMDVLQEECGKFPDQLAAARPISFLGNSFWTVR